MTFKSIDLQMSIPRTQEASGYHGQQLQRSANEQAMLAGDSHKQAVKERQMSTGIEETSGQTIRDREPGKQGGGQSKERRKDTKAGAEAAPAKEHPYKGKHIDISF
ncbi:hypothetical protein [Paenibacillus tarimensis]|uniref:hypothetical protein n=1 Tax=Paenibacillus tarimensis TaxID=416012 RepID=UPI001F386864|nr:hypothetical protein [Paenibacillus tarimensis]MCF2942333.1 hypothetical protein [Paenibacillus tarimensis]